MGSPPTPTPPSRPQNAPQTPQNRTLLPLPNPSLHMDLDPNHFDYYIRLNDLSKWIIIPSVKNELKSITKLSKAELNYFKDLYTKYGEPLQGLTFPKFNVLCKEIYGLSYYPLAEVLLLGKNNKGKDCLQFF
jgi:hypothetical protein